MSSSTVTMQSKEGPAYDITFDAEDGAVESVFAYCPITGETFDVGDFEDLPGMLKAKIDEFIRDWQQEQWDTAGLDDGDGHYEEIA